MACLVTKNCLLLFSMDKSIQKFFDHALDGNNTNLDADNIVRVSMEELLLIQISLNLCSYEAFKSGLINFDQTTKEYVLAKQEEFDTDKVIINLPINLI